MSTIAAILAGGSGSRIGGALPKQMLLLGGKPVLEHSVATFDGHPRIDAVVIVCREDLIPVVEEIVARGGYRKVRAVVPGGDTRFLSSLAAIRAACTLDGHSDQGAVLLLHDAARPLVDAALIDRCLDAMEQYDAVEPAIPLADTVVRVDDAGLLADVPPRAALRAVQTPQCFRLSLLAEAYRRAEKALSFTDSQPFIDSPSFTDDISVVRHAFPDLPVKVVDGSSRNLKLTVPSDLSILEALL